MPGTELPAGDRVSKADGVSDPVELIVKGRNRGIRNNNSVVGKC